MSARSFYCDQCDAWTPVATGEHVDPDSDPSCSFCGELYHCGECGHEIDRAGHCQRPAVLGYCPDSRAQVGES